MRERLYHIDSVNVWNETRTRMTRYPMPHAQCCVMLKKFTSHAHRRLELVEVIQMATEVELIASMVAA